MYPPGEYDLAGFTVGAVEKSQLLDGAQVREGDVLIGIASSGPHSNGYSLIRKIYERAGAPADLVLDDGVALIDALKVLKKRGSLKGEPLKQMIAAVSVGIYQGEPVLDLDYPEDSDCDTDMNVVMNDGGGFIELQGTAEGHAFRRDELNALLALAEKGVGELFELQRAALAG